MKKIFDGEQSRNVALYTAVALQFIFWMITFIFLLNLCIRQSYWIMFQFPLVWAFALFIVCLFCGKDFRSIGRHSWRCKKNCSVSGDVSIQMLQDDSGQACKQIMVKCSCGKECTGVIGLKMHQRRCRVIEKMDDDQRSEFEFLNYDASGDSTNEQEVDGNKRVAVQLKPGMKLPRSHHHHHHHKIVYCRYTKIAIKTN